MVSSTMFQPTPTFSGIKQQMDLGCSLFQYFNQIHSNIQENASWLKYTQWFCIIGNPCHGWLHFVPLYYGGSVFIKVFKIFSPFLYYLPLERGSGGFFFFNMTWNSCNNVALPYFTFKILKIGDGYVFAARPGSVYTKNKLPHKYV